MISFIASCDAAELDADADAETTANATTPDTDTELGSADSLSCEPIAEVGAPVLGHAVCVRGNATIAACGGTDPLLRPCDAGWVEHCGIVGATVDLDDTSRVKLTSFLDQTVACSDTVPLQRACDTEFQDECARIRSTFIALSASGSQGQCIPVRDCSASARCPGGGVISCKVEGDGTCSGTNGVGVQCIRYAKNGDPIEGGGVCGS